MLKILIIFFVAFAEPLREHKNGAFQNPGGRRERSDAHVLQPGQGGMALETR